MIATVDIGTLIVRSPDVRGGRPRLAGTGVTVQRVVSWYKMGLSPEEITQEVSHLSLAQVYAALAYYHANRDEIESAWIADEMEAERVERQHHGIEDITLERSKCEAKGVYRFMNSSTLDPSSRIIARMVPFRMGFPFRRGTGITRPSLSRTHSS